MFSSLPLLFAQRISPIATTGLIPTPSYNDFVDAFVKYDGKTLIQTGMKFVDKAKNILKEIKEETVVSTDVNLFFVNLYQRVCSIYDEIIMCRLY